MASFSVVADMVAGIFSRSRLAELVRKMTFSDKLH